MLCVTPMLRTTWYNYNLPAETSPLPTGLPSVQKNRENSNSCLPSSAFMQFDRVGWYLSPVTPKSRLLFTETDQRLMSQGKVFEFEEKKVGAEV